jgi:hypothetical protein
MSVESYPICMTCKEGIHSGKNGGLYAWFVEPTHEFLKKHATYGYDGVQYNLVNWTEDVYFPLDITLMEEKC